MLKRIAVLALASVTIAATWPDALTMHEWGTFTTVAGENGRATHWLPLAGPTDLPCFVEHFQNSRTFKIVPGAQAIDYEAARSKLWGKVRMETPVIYFYSRPERTVDVRVQFPRGWMTEWYPSANVGQPYVTTATQRDVNHTSFIEWKNVQIASAGAKAPLTEPGESHYYAARATEATPLRVRTQHEKFLFYRGVGDFDVPIAAQALPDGAVRVSNLGPDVFPAVILFERRGDKLGYRIQTNASGEVTFDAPALDGTIDALRAELKRLLVQAKLYDREADAMLATWRDSWFEDGARVFYIVPRRAIDAILPMQINPAPDNVARVFVGRMEVVTPATLQTVERAITRDDQATLARYARFLGPISERILAKNSSPEMRERVNKLTNAALMSYVRKSTVCE